MISDEEMRQRLKAFAETTGVTMEQFGAALKVKCDAIRECGVSVRDLASRTADHDR